MKFLQDSELFVFDLDGTLVNSKQDIAASLNHALLGMGLPEKTAEQIDELLVQGSMSIVRRLVNSDELFSQAYDLFLQHYAEHLLDETRLVPRALELLDHLRDKHITLMSNKRERFCHDILQGLGVHDRFSMVLGGDSLKARKPDPKALQHILQKSQVSPHCAVMVGDSPVDVEAGRAAGMYTVGLAAGFSTRSMMEAAQPDILVEDLSDLLRCLCE